MPHRERIAHVATSQVRRGDRSGGDGYLVVVSLRIQRLFMPTLCLALLQAGACDESEGVEVQTTSTTSTDETTTSTTGVACEACDATTLAAIHGRGFRLLALVVGDEVQSVRAGLNEPGIGFGEDGKIVGSTGINRFDQQFATEPGSGYAVESGKLVVRGGIGMTQLGAAGVDSAGLANQESWLLQVVGGADISVAGDMLTLATPTVRAVLIASQAQELPALSLENRRWQLHRIVGQGGAQEQLPLSAEPSRFEVSLSFEGTASAGTLSFDDGCSAGTGTYTRQGDVLTLSDVVVDSQACVTPFIVERVEAIGRVLQSGNAVTIESHAHHLALIVGDDRLDYEARVDGY